MSGLKSNKNFELPVWSNSVLDIQEYFEHIIKKHESVADNLPIRMHGNNIENTITFKMKTGYCLHLLSPDIMKIVGSTKSKMIKDENCEISFKNYWSRISSMQYCQQWLSARF